MMIDNDSKYGNFKNVSYLLMVDIDIKWWMHSMRIGKYNTISLANIKSEFISSKPFVKTFQVIIHIGM